MRKMFLLKCEDTGSVEKLINVIQTLNSQLHDQRKELGQEIIYQLITSKLPKDFDATIQSLNARERLPTLTELHEILRSEVDRKDINDEGTSTGKALSNLKEERTKNLHKQKVKCSHCNKRGHTENKCWFKNGKLPEKKTAGAFSICNKEKQDKNNDVKLNDVEENYSMLEYVKFSQH